MAAPGKNTAVLDSVTAPLRKYLDDARVTELVINRPGEVGIERRGGWTWESEPSLDFKNLMALATAAAAFTSQVHPRKPDRLDDLPHRRTGANHRAARRPRRDGLNHRAQTFNRHDDAGGF